VTNYEYTPKRINVSGTRITLMSIPRWAQKWPHHADCSNVQR